MAALGVLRVDNGDMPAELITVAHARDRVLQAVRPLAHGVVEVSDALDRVLAQDVVAAGDVPGFACSAMDGYALAPGPAGRDVVVVGQSRAGVPCELTPGAGEAIRVSTGAALPAGATAVVAQENVARRGETIHTTVAVALGENIREAGDDLRAGSTVLPTGTKLGVAELGAAVAAGAGRLRVARQPRVTVLCTGDELRGPGAALGPGQIHNSNAPMLTALAARGGAVVVRAERVGDDPERTRESLAAALGEADLVVVSGGVSVGPHDHVKPALTALEVHEIFWGVALQPGKPTWFGARGDQLVFGLPGNPVSAVVTFVLFVRRALAALQGEVQRSQEPQAELGVAVPRDPTRAQALRVRLEQRDDRTVALVNGAQESHRVSSLLGADALAMIPPGDGEIEAGARVALEPLPR